MKTIFKNLLAITLVIFAAAGCKKENISPGNANTDPLVGTWKVSSFVKDNVDLTSQFNDYVFHCLSNGTMVINGDSVTYNNCGWKWDDNDHSMCNFHLMGCDSGSILWEIDEDWDLISHDATHCNFSSHNPNHNCTMNWVKN